MSDQPPKTFSSMTPKMSFVLFQPNERKSQNRFSKGWVISLTMMFWQGFLISQYNSNHYSFIGVVKKGFLRCCKIVFPLDRNYSDCYWAECKSTGSWGPSRDFSMKKTVVVSGVVKKTSRDSLWCAIVEQKQEDNWEYLHLLLDKAAVVSNNPRKCIKQKNIKEKHSSLGVDFS